MKRRELTRRVFLATASAAVGAGSETSLQSRCTDDTGYTQPTRTELVAVRGLHPGPDGFNHYNGIKTWYVHRDGKVSHE
jgi:sulfane dehydrogenase subunit SoxC